jgi:hypothetical protein
MKNEEELIWESYVLLESFKDFKRKKLDEGVGEVKLGEFINRFKNLKDKNILTGQEKDISYWIKRPFHDFFNYVSEQENELKKRESAKSIKKFNINAIKKDPNVNLIYFEGGIVAFGVRNFEGASKWASQTTDWCVTKDDGHYDSYTEDSVFVFVFNLNKEPYNIHTKDGDPKSKLAYRFDGDGDVRDVHDAPDDEVSYDQDHFDTPYFDDIKEWAIENFDELSGVNFDKLYDEAEAIMEEANSNLKYGNISMDGQNKDDWYVSGYFSYDLSMFDFKEGVEDINKKIEYILNDHCDYHDFEYHDNSEEFTLYINPEYNYGRSFDGGNNPITDAVREVESILEDLDRHYYNTYYRIYGDFVKEGLIEDDDPIGKLLNVYEDINNNHIVIINGRSIHSYKKQSELNIDISKYILERFNILKKEISSQLELPFTEQVNQYAGQDIDTLISNLLNTRQFKYGHLGVGIDIEVLEAIGLSTRRMSSRDEPKKEEELNLKVIYKILGDDDRLKSDIKNIMDGYLIENKITFKKVFYS